jgi:Putative peptidoglycan binding domain
MKKIALPVLILILSVIVIWQYRQLRRLSPPDDYEYTFREDIDVGYHDPGLVADYYETGYSVGTFAREAWRTHGIDVRHPDGDWALSRNAGVRYDRLRAVADTMGLRLSRSLALKKQGLDNDDIQAIEAGGATAEQVRVQKYFHATRLMRGDKSAAVTLLQGKLLDKGYTIPHDGYFWTETEQALLDFQQKNKLTATGVADLETLHTLITR